MTRHKVIIIAATFAVALSMKSRPEGAARPVVKDQFADAKQLLGEWHTVDDRYRLLIYEIDLEFYQDGTALFTAAVRDPQDRAPLGGPGLVGYVALDVEYHLSGNELSYSVTKCEPGNDTPQGRTKRDDLAWKALVTLGNVCDKSREYVRAVEFVNPSTLKFGPWTVRKVRR
jgi:hypothetical protein